MPIADSESSPRPRPPAQLLALSVGGGGWSMARLTCYLAARPRLPRPTPLETFLPSVSSAYVCVSVYELELVALAANGLALN